MTKRYSSLPAILLALALVCSWCAGCANKEPAPNQPAPAKKEAKVRIGFLVKMPEEPWFQNEWKFAQKAADKYGFDLVKIGATDGEKVLSAIDNLSAQGAQGFVICTPDVRLGPAIVAKATAANMKVYTIDDQFVDADGKPMDVHYTGISGRQIGESVGKELAEEMKRRGWKPEETGAAAITFDELATAKDRTDGATASLTAAGFPAERVFHSPEKTTDTEGGFNAANTLLTQHPEVKHWLAYALNDEGVMGAVRAMEGRGFSAADIIGVGIGGNTCLVEFEKPAPSGFFASVLLSPVRHGYETSEMLYKWIAEGIEPPKDIRTSGIMITRENYRQVLKEQGLDDQKH
ncbi:MAG: arabinose ABC transporter substrate-binding protein [Candidatus Hydrogenedentes bacterium]|nr:arabinose ABC transporter substrate-binding protein [Candidatus Hydrogenedentota bacterium]